MALSIFIAGDVVPRRRTIPLFKNGEGRKIFASIESEVKNADVSIINFESPVDNGQGVPIGKYGPSLSTTVDTMKLLKDVGFNVITLANNHFRDMGQQGVNDTIDTAKRLEVNIVGGGKEKSEARSMFVITLNSQKMAIINACENEFSIATNHYGGANPLDLISMDEDIVAAKKNADYVILILHGGVEHYQLPTPRMKRLYRHFIDMGADAVVNHHQHCLSGYELYNGKPIFYGLGNFCFDSSREQGTSSWNFGFAVRLIFKDEICFELIPYKQCAESPCIELRDYQSFKAEIEQLNTIIADDNKLNEMFNEYTLSHKYELLGSLLPFGRYLMWFYKRGFFGQIYNTNKLLRITNRINCESHHEVLSRLLEILTNR